MRWEDVQATVRASLPTEQRTLLGEWLEDGRQCQVWWDPYPGKAGEVRTIRANPEVRRVGHLEIWRWH